MRGQITNEVVTMGDINNPDIKWEIETGWSGTQRPPKSRWRESVDKSRAASLVAASPQVIAESVRSSGSGKFDYTGAWGEGDLVAALKQLVDKLSVPPHPPPRLRPLRRRTVFIRTRCFAG